MHLVCIQVFVSFSFSGLVDYCVSPNTVIYDAFQKRPIGQVVMSGTFLSEQWLTASDTLWTSKRHPVKGQKMELRAKNTTPKHQSSIHDSRDEYQCSARCSRRLTCRRFRATQTQQPSVSQTAVRQTVVAYWHRAAGNQIVLWLLLRVPFLWLPSSQSSDPSCSSPVTGCSCHPETGLLRRDNVLKHHPPNLMFQERIDPSPKRDIYSGIFIYTYIYIYI